MINIIYKNYEFRREIEYTFSTIARNLGIKVGFNKNIDLLNDIIINYSEKRIDTGNVINIKPSYLFSNIYLKRESIPNEKLNIYNEIPIIYSDEEIYLYKKNCNISTNIDIIQSIFFMLTRYEEIVLWDEIEKDLYGRFASKDSLAYKEGFLDIPIVDEYIEWFWKWLKLVGYKEEKSKRWGGYDFVSCLTHDVDNPFKYRHTLIEQLKTLKRNDNIIKQFKNTIQYVISKIDYNEDPYFTFDYIRNQERKYGFTSSFYFMNGGNSSYENFYNINDKRIKNLIKNLEEDDCEVGYHYSFNSYNNLEMRKKEKCGLDIEFAGKIYGGRNHFLRFKPLESWRICEKVKLLYDTTLGYADYEGFRCGTCFPYKPFDLENKKVLEVWEAPLIVMEGTLKDEKYRNLNCKDALKEIKKKIDIVKKYHGVFTLLWHNSSFDSEDWLGWKEVFEETMAYIFESNSVGLSGKKIIDMISGEDINNEENINY